MHFDPDQSSKFVSRRCRPRSQLRCEVVCPSRPRHPTKPPPLPLAKYPAYKTSAFFKDSAVLRNARNRRISGFSSLSALDHLMVLLQANPGGPSASAKEEQESALLRAGWFCAPPSPVLFADNGSGEGRSSASPGLQRAGFPECSGSLSVEPP